jgi:imidazolonepropionase-like amidohydrolase
MLPILIAAAMQAVPSPAAGVPAQTIVIHAGRLLDRPGRPPRGASTIIVQNGRVSEVRDGHQPAPAGARLVDLSDRFVLPGLIDSHVHLRSDAGGREGLIEQVEGSIPKTTLRSAWEARKTLHAGFTTVRNLGDGTARRWRCAT